MLVSESLPGRVGEGWVVLRTDPPEGEVPADAPPASPPVTEAPAASFVTAAPAGGRAGSVVVVGAVAGVDDDGRVVVVDLPRPPEDWRVVLVVDGSVGAVEGEVDVVVVLESSSGVVVVVVEDGSVEGSEEMEVVDVVDDGSVGGVDSSVVDVVAVPGSVSPRSARTGAAGTQTTAKNRVAAATTRRTRLPSTRFSRFAQYGNVVEHIGRASRPSRTEMFQIDDGQIGRHG